MRTMTKEKQQKISPLDALNLLKAGNQRFVNNLNINRNLLRQVNETRDGQYPFAVIISCMDSRTSAELIFDQGLGDIFSIRIAGNIINEEILGSAEFGCKIIGAKIIVVLGHNGCGAIQGAIKNVGLGNLSSVIKRIKPSIPSDSSFENLDFDEKMSIVTKNNVQKSIQEIRDQSPLIYEMEQNHQLAIVGGVYDVTTGIVNFFDTIKSI